MSAKALNVCLAGALVVLGGVLCILHWIYPANDMIGALSVIGLLAFASGAYGLYCYAFHLAPTSKSALPRRVVTALRLSHVGRLADILVDGSCAVKVAPDGTVTILDHPDDAELDSPVGGCVPAEGAIGFRVEDGNLSFFFWRGSKIIRHWIGEVSAEDEALRWVDVVNAHFYTPKRQPTQDATRPVVCAEGDCGGVPSDDSRSWSRGGKWGGGERHDR